MINKLTNRLLEINFMYFLKHQHIQGENFQNTIGEKVSLLMRQRAVKNNS